MMADFLYQKASRRLLAGQSVAEIAKGLEISVEAVYGALYRARQAGINVPKLRTGCPAGLRTGKRIRITNQTFHALTPPAHRRGLDVHELGALILTTVAEQGLVDAVLDDGGDLFDA